MSDVAYQKILKFVRDCRNYGLPKLARFYSGTVSLESNSSDVMKSVMNSEFSHILFLILVEIQNAYIQVNLSIVHGALVAVW